MLLSEGARGTTARLLPCRDLAKCVPDQLLCCIHASTSIKITHNVQGGVAREVEPLPEVMQHLSIDALDLHSHRTDCQLW